ncbi:MAG: hypothetical protein JJE27_03560 [Thermoleophilia bacterium]|nr:hypothetical protein [Thermoleophilia bacterium]
MNRCPICSAKIPTHKLMCWTHWDMVPENLQNQVLGLWRTTLRGRTAPIRHMATEEYRKAREAAIAAVKAQLEGQA